MTDKLFDPALATEGLSKIVAANQVFEIRVLGVKKTNGYGNLSAFGIFDTVADAVSEISKFVKTHTYSGMYFTPNPLDESVMCRRPNMLDIGSRDDGMAKDADVIAIHWMLVDFDPVRPSGTTASNQQVKDVMFVSREMYNPFCDSLHARPLVLFSGNGVHMMWRVDLKTDESPLLSRCLTKMQSMLSDVTEKSVKIDIVNSNPARIWKVPGSFARKGFEVEKQGRVFRVGKLLQSPEELAVISRETLEAFAPAAEPQKTSKPSSTSTSTKESINALDWLIQKGVGVRNTAGYRDGVKHILNECPFNADHKAPDSMLIQFGDGRIVFYCSHNSCRGHGWFDLRDLHEPGWREERRGDSGFYAECAMERERALRRAMLREEDRLLRDFGQKDH